MPLLNTVLRLFFVFNYLLILFLVSGSIEFQSIYSENILTFAFLIVAFLMYGVFYLIPAFVITHITKALLKTKIQQPNSPKNKYQIIVYVVAIVTTGVTTLVFYANAKFYALYGMYINGFVLNLVFTPGGIESQGGSAATDASFAAIAVAFFLLQISLLYLAIRLSKAQTVIRLNSFKFFSNWPTSEQQSFLNAKSEHKKRCCA